MKLVTFLLLSVFLASQVFSNEGFQKEQLNGFLSKKDEERMAAFGLIINQLEKGITAEDANLIISFFAENVNVIQSDTISEIFYHFRNIEHPPTNSIFFDCLYRNYPKFKIDTQVVIFHLLLQMGYEDIETQFNRFLESYGKDLLYLNHNLMVMFIENPKEISQNLLKLISNENIKYSIYQYFFAQLKAEKLNLSDIPSINQAILQDLKANIKVYKLKPNEIKKNLTLILKLALITKIGFEEKISDTIFSLKDEEISLALIEILFSQKKTVPKHALKLLLQSPIFRFYLFTLCEKYQHQLEIISKTMTQEEIGRGQLICWFYDKMKIQVSPDKIIFEGAQKIEPNSSKTLALFKCFVEFPFSKEIIPIAASGGIFNDDKDLSFLPRQSVGSNYIPWFVQNKLKHTQNLENDNFNIYESDFDSPVLSESEAQISQFQQILQDISIGQSFFINIKLMFDELYKLKGVVYLEDENNLFELFFDSYGRVATKIPIKRKGNNFIRNGKFAVTLDNYDFVATGQFENDLLNGELAFTQDYSDLLVKLELDHNKFKRIQIFENSKQVGSFSFSNQVLNGLFTIKNEEGRIINQCNYKSGKRFGESREFYDNGKLKKTLNFKNGLPDGALIKYDEEGNIVLKMEFVKNWSGTIWQYYSGGQLKLKGFIKDFLLNGSTEEYFESGRLKTTITYLDSLPEGNVNVYFENGLLKSQTIYAKGLRQGKEIHYYENGKMKFEINYIDDLMEGQCNSYYFEGELQNTLIFKNNIANGQGYQYNKKGEVIAQNIVEKGEVKDGMSFDDKTLELLEYKDFKLIKRYLCDADGKILREVELIDKKRITFLTNAIKKGNVSFIATIIKRDLQLLNADLGEGKTALHLVCSHDTELINACELLIDLNAELDIQDNFGNTPLHYALERNYYDLINLLLLHDPNLTIENKLGVIAIEELLKKPNIATEDYITENLYKVYFKNGQNLLHLAAKFNQVKLIQPCIDSGIELNAKDKSGNSALNFALINDSKEASDLLISLKPEISLFDLVCLGDLNEITKEINSKPEKINQQDGLGNTLLNYSIMKGKTNIFEFLVAKKAQLEIKNNEKLDAISLALVHNMPHLFDRLVSMGMEINEVFGTQQFALHYMTKYGWAHLLNKYTEKGFSLKISTPKEPNLLFVAVANNQENVVKYLIEKGIDVNEANHLQINCVQISLKNNNQNIFKILQKNGGKVELKEAILLGDMTLIKKSFQEFKDSGNYLYKSGFLHLAIEVGLIETVQFLVEKGLDVNDTNEKFVSPFQHCLMLNREKIAEYLISKGANVFDSYDHRQKENWLLASENGLVNILILMVKNGFELNSPNANIMLKDSVAKGYHEVVALIIGSEAFIYPEKLQKELLETAKNNQDENMLKVLYSKTCISHYENEMELNDESIYEAKTDNKKIKNGVFKKFDKDGKLIMSGNYLNNLLEGQIFEAMPSNFFWSHYSIANYSKGVLEGLKTTYYNDKKKEAKLLLSQEMFNKGVLNGVCSYFLIPNIKVMEITYENGLKNGPFKEWINANYLISDLEFKNDKIWNGYAILKEGVDINEISFSFEKYRSQLENVRKAVRWQFEKGSLIKKETLLLPKTNANAIDTGLDFLQKSQDKAGFWDPGIFDGKTTDQSKALCTANCLLAFLGAGHTDKAGKYKKNVKLALIWLLSAQREDGSFANDNIVNGLCTQALAEATGMGCMGREMKLGAEKACKFILSQQNASGGFNNFGKSENLETGEYDKMPATAFCIMGLKTAILAGIFEVEIRMSFKKADHLFDRLPNTGDQTENTKGHAWFHGGGNFKESSNGGTHQAMALLVRQYLGHERYEPWLKAASTELSLNLPKDHSTINYVQTYFQFLTLFQQGGDAWDNWHFKASDLLFQAQSDEEKFFSSWPKIDFEPFSDGGRITSTALAILSLEIFYRYKLVMR